MKKIILTAASILTLLIFQNCGSESSSNSQSVSTKSFDSIKNIWIYDQGKTLLSQHTDFSKNFFFSISSEPPALLGEANFYRGVFDSNGKVIKFIPCKGDASIDGSPTEGVVTFNSARCVVGTGVVPPVMDLKYEYFIEDGRLTLCSEGSDADRCGHYILGESL